MEGIRLSKWSSRTEKEQYREMKSGITEIKNLVDAETAVYTQVKRDSAN